jgi:uncharacterized protein YukE
VSIPVPTGDPASLRFVASRLRATADELCELSDQIRAQLSTMIYEGAAGDRFREAVGQAHQRVHAQAGEMGGRARVLDGRASDIEQALAAGGLP